MTLKVRHPVKRKGNLIVPLYSYITGFNRIHILNQNNGFIVNMK